MEFEQVDLPGHEGRKGYFMHTWSGGRYFPCDPRHTEVQIEDIATALSRKCRFGGHTHEFMSVAEHSVLVSLYKPELDPFEKLMHDAPEGYVDDMIRPLKMVPQLREPYIAIEELNAIAIAQRYDLTYPWPASVKEADEAICTLEMEYNISAVDKGSLHDASILPKDIKIQFWTPKQAKQAFLDRFTELYRDRMIKADPFFKTVMSKRA